MLRYLVDGGSDRYDFAAKYLGMALRVAAQLDYHKAMRAMPINTIVNCDKFEKAIKWSRTSSRGQTEQSWSCGVSIYSFFFYAGKCHFIAIFLQIWLYLQVY